MSVQLRKDGPYVFATWLARLMAGNASCEWQAWFQVQYDGKSWRKRPSDFDEAAWKVEHAQMLHDEVAHWESLGYTVKVENQNWIRLPGRRATLGGKPDIVVLKDDDQGIIVDTKTGQPKEADVVQVMLYMYALPRLGGLMYGRTFDGRVVYKDHSIDIPAAQVDAEFVKRIGAQMHTLASPVAPRRRPSFLECRFCPITVEDCPDRVDDEPRVEATTDF